MKAIIRKDEDAVSPVIATILMVAITVVLAAVLYVMVSGLITSPGSTPKAMGVSISQAANGNWTALFSNVPTGLTSANTFLTVIGSGGNSTSLTNQPLSAFVAFPLSGPSFHVTYYAGSTTQVSAGDRLVFTQGWNGYQIQLSSGGTVLYTGTLH
jgi:flagellin-like protein